MLIIKCKKQKKGIKCVELLKYAVYIYLLWNGCYTSSYMLTDCEGKSLGNYSHVDRMQITS